MGKREGRKKERKGKGKRKDRTSNPPPQTKILATALLQMHLNGSRTVLWHKETVQN